MAITAAHLQRGLNARFQQALQQEIDQRLMATMMVVNSTGRTENYGWMEAVPTLTEVIDEVSISGVIKSNYDLTNKTYAQAISARREDLEDDQVGGILQRAQDLTVRGRLFPQKLLLDEIVANGTTYDGQAFFSVSHQTGSSGIQSNLLTGTGIALTDLELDFNTAFQSMLDFQDATGNPIHETDVTIRPLVLCPTALFGLFRQLQNAAIINNTTNTLQGVFDLVSSARLTDADDWYMFNTGSTIKPFVLQQRQALALESLQSDSDLGVLKERYAWKIRWRGRVGYGFWTAAVKTTN